MGKALYCALSCSCTIQYTPVESARTPCLARISAFNQVRDGAKRCTARSLAGICAF
ncbi:MAG: hypothetical protein IKC37_03885 [Clostridia bacterium]|nr:hypothetical protein [Clostridia bacterium]